MHSDHLLEFLDTLVVSGLTKGAVLTHIIELVIFKANELLWNSHP
jgi:hypothetical protein